MSGLAQLDPFLIDTFYNVVGSPVFLLLWIVNSLMELLGPSNVGLWMLYSSVDVGLYIWNQGLRKNAVMFAVMSIAVFALALVDINLTNDKLLEEEQKTVGNRFLG
jgi:hypothetical protein